MGLRPYPLLVPYGYLSTPVCPRHPKRSGRSKWLPVFVTGFGMLNKNLYLEVHSAVVL